MSALSPTTITELYAAVDIATKRYEEARAAADEADRTATTLLNELNGAQKALDVAVAKLKQAAPSSSDWKQQQSPSRSL